MPGFQRYISVHSFKKHVFSFSFRPGQRQRCYGTAVRTRLRKRFTETDADERKRNAGNQH